MVTVKSHCRNRWVMRGDLSTRVEDAWSEGIKVDCEHRTYGEARYHPETETILLKRGGKITTILSRYDHVEMEFRTKINCTNCGCHHHNRNQCPNCGAVTWSCTD